MENRITEQASAYDNLQRMSVHDILTGINREDARVHEAVAKTIPVMERLVERVVERMERGGRMFYIGAGTSGRLGVTDASELPPTYGVPFDRVIGLIAGGDGALRRAVENAEDDTAGAWRDMAPYHPTADDVLVGIAASGTTPYVVGGLRMAREHGLLTASITCNPSSPVAAEAEYALEAVVGPEFVTGSTRMKAGTAQKLMLNMLSTAVMIRLGRVEGNRMVNMQLTNDKLVGRGTRMVAEASGLSEAQARALLLQFVDDVRFDRLGVFAYSEEEGTYSALHLKDDVPDEVKRRRVERIMERQKAISLDNNLRRVGRTERVVVDARQGDYYVCRTQYDSPEVDQELLIPAGGRRLRRGCFYEARITAAEEYDLYGELTERRKR